MQDWAETENNNHQAGYVRNPLEGTLLTVGELLITIKASGKETKGAFSLLEFIVPPYFANSIAHLHRHTTEMIYLTQGMLAITLGEETMVVRQGSSILVPPAKTHRIWNPAATSATFLLYFAPAGVELFFEELAEMQLPLKSCGLKELITFWALGVNYDYFPGDLPTDES